jgi:hypothetical protein
LAWLLAGDDIAPIPGTKWVSRIEENTASGGAELIARLNELTPASGERNNQASMATIDVRPKVVEELSGGGARGGGALGSVECEQDRHGWFLAAEASGARSAS